MIVHNIEFYQIDAFTDKVFHGNPAAVCILDDWLNDELLKAIAAQNTLAETAFIIKDNQDFHIRWFTPNGEISLSGHATLAAGFVLLESNKGHGNFIVFHHSSGQISVEKRKEKFILHFPRIDYKKSLSPDPILSLLDQPAIEVFETELDYLVLLENESQIRNLQIDLFSLAKLPKRGIIVTSTTTEADFYSRCFYPKHSIAEDPVTGSAHCILAPFWAEKLNKTTLYAIQGLHRKGELYCELQRNSVLISGNCRWYLRGHLVI
ncbi:TPA: PhzF family phenazine biosynthesis isomerase [Legionella pneumophila]|nr:PhzF family phenazine biosynthesis isomerase [Legionella pneumophila]HAT8181249.1 PhzF family phenazine biosynthesis isomerase [Legionella pneumophila]